MTDLPEGLTAHIDTNHPRDGYTVTIYDAQDVPWVTITNGGWGDESTDWQQEITKRVCAALGVEVPA